jgi:hypothetical protein
VNGEKPDLLTVTASGANRSGESTTFGSGVITWSEQDCSKTMTMPFGRYLTVIDADLFAVDIAAKEIGSTPAQDSGDVSDQTN